MATVAGKDADLTVLGYDVHAHGWSMDIVADVLEDTNWDWTGDDVGWKSHLAGLRGWSGSFECFADSAPATGILPGTIVAAAKFYVNKGTNKGFSGKVLIGGTHPGVTIEGVETLTVDFTGIGAPTVGTI